MPPMTVATILGFALLDGLSTTCFAETWHLKGEGGQIKSAELTLERSNDQSIQGLAQVIDADDVKRSARVFGSRRQFLIQGDAVCSLGIKQSSPIAVSGTASCGGGIFNWSATIDGGTVATKPSLLKEGDNPRASQAYKSLSAGNRSSIDLEVENYRKQEESLGEYAVVRDIQCLSDQYLNVRLQKPDWSTQAIETFIQFTCVFPESVNAQAKNRCIAIYGGDSSSTSYSAGNPNFCACYADKYTEKFVNSANNNDLVVSTSGADIAGECQADQ
ncbi:hypothetical protein [Rhizobium tubonense]|uniref:Uncharacterized protein n=1 Tax=Rhizobium tubonense TaxID=484088 RepID=A0A2W4CT07_9HYPH|nr:hypothetical protein [Rhizobium tubonense]PZM15539.1 hypothetical protein CPY51_06865 [Rhizobium tubonense]